MNFDQERVFDTKKSPYGFGFDLGMGRFVYYAVYF